MLVRRIHGNHSWICVAPWQTVSSSAHVKVLSNKRWLASGLSPLQLLLMLSVSTIAIALFMVAAVLPDDTWDQRWSRLIDDKSHIDWSRVYWTRVAMNAVVFALIFLQLQYICRAKKMERLTLSPEGIMYTSPYPAFLQQFSPDWFLPWNEVVGAELTLPDKRLSGANAVQLILSGSVDSRRISPTSWIDPANYSPHPLRFKFSTKPATQTHEELIDPVMDSEVIRYISTTRPNLSIDSNLGTGIVASSLHRHQHGRTAMVIIITLLAYAIIDYFVSPDAYAVQ